jgi:hypothetical protein
MFTPSTDPRITRILAKPAIPWMPPTGQQMLRYRVRADLTPDGSKLSATFLGADTPHIMGEALRGPMTLHTTGGASRVELSGGAIFIRATAQGVLFIDDAARRYLHCDEEQFVRTVGQSPAEYVISNQEQGEWLGRPVRIITLTGNAGNVRLRGRVSLLDDRALQPFSEEVARAVMGCGPAEAQSCGAIVSAGGLPVRGEIFFSTDSQGEQRASSFEIEELMVLPYDPGLFSIPPGYQDARDHSGGEPLPPGMRFRDNAPPAPRAETGDSAIQATASEPAMEAAAPVPQSCRCLPGTYAADVAQSVEENLFETLRSVTNLITKRLTGFHGRDGKFRIAWLEDFKQFSSKRMGGDGLFCFLREDPPVARQLGEVDRLAESLARSDLADKSFAALKLDFTGADDIKNAVLAVYSPMIAPSDRYDKLDKQKDAFRELYLQQKVGLVTIDYPSSTDWVSVLNDLLQVKIERLEFDIDINDPMNQDLSHRNVLFETLSIDTNGHITFKASLEGGHGQAYMGRVGGSLYWSLVFFGPLGCLAVPFACWLVPLISTIGQFFFFDFAYISIDLRDIKIDGMIDWVPDPDRTDGSIVPHSNIQLTMTRDVQYISFFPSSLAGILSALISIVASHLDALVTFVAGELGKRLDDVLRNTMKFRFPPDTWRVPTLGLSASADSVANEHLDLVARFDVAPAGAGPFVTLVDDKIKEGLRDGRDEFKKWLEDLSKKEGKPALPYGGFAFSQNFLNHFTYQQWLRNRYDYKLSLPEAAAFIDRLHRICPACGGSGQLIGMKVCPAVSPRVVVTPYTAAGGGAYLTTFFDDVRLCIEIGLVDELMCQLELKFAAQVGTEIGFGRVNHDTGMLDITKILDGYFALYHDASPGAVKIGPLEISDLVSLEAGCILGLKLTDLNHLEDALQTIMQNSFSRYDWRVIPRAASDPRTVQRYPLFKDHDVVFRYTSSRGILYGHVGAIGQLTTMLLDTTLIDLLDCGRGKMYRT